MKATAEIIANLQKAVTDVQNRFHALEDRVRIAEEAVAASKALLDAAESATLNLNTLGS